MSVGLNSIELGKALEKMADDLKQGIVPVSQGNLEFAKIISDHIKKANIQVSGNVILTKIELDKLINGSPSSLILPIANIEVIIS